MKIAIVGAGLAGLIAAHDLKAAGLSITLFDKARGVGGRCATRSTDWGMIDHGVQLLDGSDARIKALIARFDLDVSTITFNPGKYQPVPGNGPFLRPNGGARRLAEQIAEPLDVRLSHTVTGIEQADGAWTLTCGTKKFAPFDALILAIPPLQAAAFGLNTLALNLELPQYTPQAAALIADTKPLHLPPTGPLEMDGLAWITKSDDGKRATVLTGEPLSSALMQTDKGEIAQLLWARLGGGAEPAYLKGHRWLYSRVDVAMGATCHWDRTQKLGFCGDWFIGANVGDAVESGAAVAAALLS